MNLNSKELRSVIIAIAGEDGIVLVKQLRKSESTVEDLAKKLGKKPVHIRKTLYRLYDFGFVTTKEEKNEEHKGWLKFTWMYSQEKAEEALAKFNRKKQDAIGEKIEYQKSHVFYKCTKCGENYLYEKAMNLNFECNLCGCQIDFFDNKDELSCLEKEMKKCGGADDGRKEQRGA